MSHIMKQVRVGASVMLVTLLGSVPVVAEDIEIYLNENTGAAGAQPNILFILDTSGSMGGLISTRPLYDIRLDYKAMMVTEGIPACALFVDTEMYFLPGSDDFKDVTCSTTYSNSHFDTVQSVCSQSDRALYGQKLADGSYDYAKDALGNDIIDPIAYGIALDPLNAGRVVQGGVGFKADRYTQWTGPSANTWDEFVLTNTQATKYIECESDEGIHGLNDTTTDTWVDRTQGAGWASSDQRLNWRQISDPETFYSAHYAQYLLYASAVTPPAVAKIDIMRDTIITIMDGGVSSVDVGLMKFNSPGDNSGGTVMHPILPITLARNDLFATMKTWNADGWTPLSESLYEAKRYFAGELPLYGGTGSETIEGTTVLNTGGGKAYRSPVDPLSADCERQFIILLSDGEPFGDTEANTLIGGLPDFVGIEGTFGACDGYGYSGWPLVKDFTSSNGKCLDDLTKYLANEGIDVALNDNPASVSAASLTGDIAKDVKITTYTVGFAIDSELLEEAGIEGAGPSGYKTANSADELLKTLIDLIEEIKGIDTTFASPAVSVNAFNRTTHRNDLYFTLFKPDSKAHWDGNFKRFKLAFDTLGVPSIVDANDNNAIDPVTGFFVDSSESFWTAGADLPDGSKTEKGGTASKLTNTRIVYSNLDTAADLTAAANRVEESNANLTDAVMGGVTGVDKDNLIKWARGLDMADIDADGDLSEARRQMGDPLHAQPALIEYKDGATADPYIISYVATNDGYLHAIDTRTTVAEPAKELFSFIPKDLLANLNTVFVNTSTNKQYGLDGTVSSWIKDKNLDGIIDPIDDQVIIFFGMRRGGNDYYALDVTVPTSPKFLWKIDGGVGDFAELGQSWSTPQVRKIRLDGKDKQVIIFSAGYDTDKVDTAVTTRTADDIGRGLYIVDALTGARLWYMGPTIGANLQNTDMVYSMPSDVAAADASGDGYVDHLYVGDMGGQLWRIDINNNLGETTSSINGLITGGRIGDLADNSVASNRRFFYPPDVAILKDAFDQSYLAVLITSGNRTHPTDKIVQDRVFMIKDLPVFGKPISYTTITSNDSTDDLFDTTDNLIGQGSDIEKTTALSSLQSNNGWYINFDAVIGEKGLTKPLIFLGEAFFATYVPHDLSLVSTSCAPAQGTGYLYHINLENGTPVKNYDLIVDNDPNALTKEDRKKTLTRSGIPADPTLVIPSDGAAVCVGTECDKAVGVDTHKRVYWFEE